MSREEHAWVTSFIEVLASEIFIKSNNCVVRLEQSNRMEVYCACERALILAGMPVFTTVNKYPSKNI